MEKIDNLSLVVGKEIQHLRKERKLTQDNLAQLLQISPESYAKIEAGHAPLSLVHLHRISQIFGMNVIELLKLAQPDWQPKDTTDTLTSTYSIFGNVGTFYNSFNIGTDATLIKRMERLEFAFQKLIQELNKK